MRTIPTLNASWKVHGRKLKGSLRVPIEQVFHAPGQAALPNTLLQRNMRPREPKGQPRFSLQQTSGTARTGACSHWTSHVSRVSGALPLPGGSLTQPRPSTWLGAGSASVSHGCCAKHDHQHCALAENPQIYPHPGLEIRTLQSRGRLGSVLSRGSWGASVCWPLPASTGAHLPRPGTPAPTSEAQGSTLKPMGLRHCVSLLCPDFALLLNETGDYTGWPRGFGIIPFQDTSFHHICQVPFTGQGDVFTGFRARTGSRWGDQFSVYHGRGAGCRESLSFP